MLQIHHHYPLKAFNSFGIQAYARRFAKLEQLNDFELIFKEEQKIRLLGGGSNILFREDPKDFIIWNQLKGIRKLEEDAEYVWIEAAAGELWHELVLWCIERDYAGIENLSLIPGSVGAAPIQNIGAYGVELKDVFYELDAINLSTGELQTFDAKACHFGYRNSIFKQALRGKYCITAVRLQLYKQAQFNTSYGAIQAELGDRPLTLRNLSNAVISIRQSKLPDPKVIGNAGSFFKNPVIERSQYENLLEHYPTLPSYPVEDEQFVKVPAGWLIDKAGWKGKRQAKAGVHENQALVLVNYGGARGADIWQLAMDIQADIQEKYGIELEPEVNLW
jgi:UDP-N-acetylmuramate dehydrogenase